MKTCNLLASFESVRGTLRYDYSNKTSKKYFHVIIYTEVVVNFLSQLICIFLLFWGMVMLPNEFETEEKQKFTEIKKLTAIYICYFHI